MFRKQAPSSIIHITALALEFFSQTRSRCLLSPTSPLTFSPPPHLVLSTNVTVCVSGEFFFFFDPFCLLPLLSAPVLFFSPSEKHRTLRGILDSFPFLSFFPPPLPAHDVRPFPFFCSPPQVSVTLVAKSAEFLSNSHECQQISPELPLPFMPSILFPFKVSPLQNPPSFPPFQRHFLPSPMYNIPRYMECSSPPHRSDACSPFLAVIHNPPPLRT